jgi:hypothetical protein
MAAGPDWHSHFEPFMGPYYRNIEWGIDDAAAGHYGPACRRLSQIKGRYDPMNLFRLNSNVKPAVPE